MGTSTFENKSGLVPGGIYPAMVVDCYDKSLPNSQEQYLKMLWKIESGPCKDRLISQGFYIYSSDPLRKQRQEKKLEFVNKAIFGKHEVMDPEDYIGHTALIEVADFTPPDSDEPRSYVKRVLKHAKDKSKKAVDKTNETKSSPFRDDEIAF